MLKVHKIKNEQGTYNFKIENEENALNIFFGGNGDLYFFVSKRNLLDEKQIVNFEITKENYVLYELFKQLYNQIIDCDIYKIDKLEELEFYSQQEIVERIRMYKEWNDDLKKGFIYRDLVRNGVISWRNDEQIYEEANTLNIYKEEGKYRLEFILKNKELSHFIDIRFRNSGSRYTPFNISFMELYQCLQLYDPKYHQVHIEEYMYQKRLKLN